MLKLDYKTFITKIQEYYGYYPAPKEESTPGIGDFVMAYLKRDIDEEKLNTLYRYLTYSHPVNYGPPDIAAIENAVIWALKNNKGADVHQVNPTDGSEYVDTITEQERKEGEEILEKMGGLTGIFEKKADSPMARWDKDRESRR